MPPHSCPNRLSLSHKKVPYIQSMHPKYSVARRASFKKKLKKHNKAGEYFVFIDDVPCASLVFPITPPKHMVMQSKLEPERRLEVKGRVRQRSRKRSHKHHPRSFRKGFETKSCAQFSLCHARINWRWFGWNQTSTWTNRILYPHYPPKRAHDGPCKVPQRPCHNADHQKRRTYVAWCADIFTRLGLRRAHMGSGKSHKEKKSVENLWKYTQLTERGYSVWPRKLRGHRKRKATCAFLSSTSQKKGDALKTLYES